MSLRIEPSLGGQFELSVGDLIDAAWRIPYDRAKSEIEFLFIPGPTLTGDRLEKENLGPSDDWHGRDLYEYRANRFELQSTKTGIEASTDKAVDVEYVKAAPSL